MAISKREVIAAFNLMENAPHIHWKIYSGMNARQGAVMASSEFANPDGNIDFKLSMAHLQKCLPLLIPGNYMIQFKKAPNAVGDIVTQYFEVEQPTAMANQQPNFNIGAMQPPAGYISTQHHELALKYERERVENEFHRKELQQSIEVIKKDLKKSKSEGGSEVMRELLSTIKIGLALIKGDPMATGPQIAVTGLNEGPVKINIANTEGNEDVQNGPENAENEKAETDAHNKKLLKAYRAVIEEMFKREGGDEGGIFLLYALNAYVKDNPDMFEAMIRPQLEKYQDSFNDYLDQL